jgi:hypothetical protein
LPLEQQQRPAPWQSSGIGRVRGSIRLLEQAACDVLLLLLLLPLVPAGLHLWQQLQPGSGWPG